MNFGKTGSPLCCLENSKLFILSWLDNSLWQRFRFWFWYWPWFWLCWWLCCCSGLFLQSALLEFFGPWAHGQLANFWCLPVPSEHVKKHIPNIGKFCVFLHTIPWKAYKLSFIVSNTVCCIFWPIFGCCKL